jgi:MFS family permease
MYMSQPARRSPRHLIGILAITQIISWGSLYYAIAILAPEIGRETGWRAELVFGAFSWALLISGLISTPAGMLLDRFGGRYVMGLGSLCAAGGFLLLGLAQSLGVYFFAWTLLGMAMAMTLYEAAFATLNREITGDVRRAISTLTLFGGFASTVFWPLTLQLDGLLGWRQTCLLYGAVHLLLCLPLHAWLSASRRQVAAAPAVNGRAVTHFTLAEAVRDPTFWKLAFAFAFNSFIFSALSVHLIPLFKQFGHPIALAVLFSAMIGPMQVAGRIGEMTIARHIAATAVGKFTFAALPAGLIALLMFGQQQWAMVAFCTLYGLSNGILTIVRGTIPQVLFGREHYGAISGAMSAASLLAKAAGPLAIAALVQRYPSPYPLLGVLLCISIASLLCYLAALRPRVQVLSAA